MKLKNGFSFLEIVVGLLIGSLLSVALFQSLFQMSKALRYVDTNAQIATDVAQLDRQFDRDFSGMFAPLKKNPPIRESDDKDQQESKKEAKPEQEKKPADKDAKEKKEEDAYEPNAFIVKSDDQNKVSMFSCITSNPALMYGNLLPRIVRVVYTLTPDKDQPGLYTLTRQQSDDLDLALFTDKSSKIRAYQLVTGISSIKIETWIEKIKKPEKNAQQKQPTAPGQSDTAEKKEQKKREFVEWQAWKKVPEEEKKQFELALVPALIKITVVFMHNKKEVEQVYWYAPLYDIQPVIIEGPSALLTNKERDGREQAQEQYGKINEQLQDFNDRVLSKKVIPPR